MRCFPLTFKVSSLIVESLLLSSAVAQCMHPNGSVTQDLYHAPCSKENSNPLSTICWAVDRPLPPASNFSIGFAADECLDSGICMNRRVYAYGTPGVQYWREECTAKDWTSGKCLNICTDNVSGVVYLFSAQKSACNVKRTKLCKINGGNVELTPCDGTANSATWCCGASKDCCTSNPIRVAAQFGESLMSSASSSILPSSTTSAFTLTFSPTTSASSTTTASSSSGLGGGSIAGIVVGAVVGLALAFLAGFLIAKKRRAANKTRMAHDEGHAGYIKGDYYEATEDARIHRMDGPPQEVEAQGSQIVEADVNTTSKNGKPLELP